MPRSKWFWALVAFAAFIGCSVITAFLIGPDENAPLTNTRSAFVLVFFVAAGAGFLASLILVILALDDRSKRKKKGAA